MTVTVTGTGSELIEFMFSVDQSWRLVRKDLLESKKTNGESLWQFVFAKEFCDEKR